MFIVGIDVGGTFTDLTAVDEATGRVVVTKVPSRPRNEAAAVLAGLDALGIASRATCDGWSTAPPSAPTPCWSGAARRVAVLTTAGFRDLIEIGRTKRNIPALFVPTFVRPKPVVERKQRFEVTERLNADGSVLVPLDVASVERALDAAVAAGAEAIAVCLLHAYLNPAHERSSRRRGQGQAPGRAGVVLGRRRGRVPGVRAVLDDRAERLPAAAHGRLPEPASSSGCAARATRTACSPWRPAAA